MNIAIKWGGTEIAVTLAPVTRADGKANVEGLLRGSFGQPAILIDRCTRRIDDVVSWQAFLEGPDCFSDEYPPTMRGLGATAQGAVDDLGKRLRELAKWVNAAMNQGQDRSRYCALTLQNGDDQ